MKVLLYTEDFPAAGGRTARHTGIGRYCHDLASGLGGAGRQVTVLAPAPERARSAGEPFDVVPLPRWDGGLIARARRVRAALRSGAGHLVVAGDPLAHRVLAVGGLPRHVPWVPVLYGTEIKALAPALRYVGWSPVALLQRNSWRRYLAGARHRVCISRFTAGLLETAMDGPVRAMIVPPAAPASFLEQPLPEPRPSGGPLRLLIIGRISERKNQLGMLRHLAALRRSSGLAFHCTLLGNVDGPAHEAYAREVHGLVAAERLTAVVTFVTEATDAEKLAQLDGCDVLLAVSRAAGHSVEGFGIAALEAGSRGKPAVVSAEGGMPEAIVEGETGFAVGPDDADAFARTLLALARDPDLRMRMGASARQRVRASFTPAEMARRLEEGLA